MKVTDAIGPQLDCMVAKCEDLAIVYHDDGITRCIMKSNGRNGYDGRFNPSTDWSQCGPIIVREEIAVAPNGCGSWRAETYLNAGDYSYGPTPLIAAMRCYVVSKLGGEVEIPEGLL